MNVRSLLLSLLTALPGVTVSAPAAEPWSFWAAAVESNPDTIDHRAWQSLLDRYLVTDSSDGVNRFRYGAIDRAGRDVLDGYVAGLAAIDPRRYRRDEQMAYWINLYNALTVRIVIEHPKQTSILDMGRGLFTIGPWNERVVEVAGQALSLNDIEHRVLRPLFKDPRIHYAVNCASLGCPNLAAGVYTGGQINAMLDAAQHRFVNDPRGVRLQNDALVLSQIFEWYRGDFAPDESGILAYLGGVVDEPLAGRLREHRGKIRYRYDWSLNAAP